MFYKLPVLNQNRKTHVFEKTSLVTSPIIESKMGSEPMADDRIEVRFHRFPHCIVWTPIPCITCVSNRNRLKK